MLVHLSPSSSYADKLGQTLAKCEEASDKPGFESISEQIGVPSGISHIP